MINGVPINRRLSRQRVPPLIHICMNLILTRTSIFLDGEPNAGGKLRLDKRDHPRIGAFRTWRATCQVGSGKIICRKISENISEGGTWTTWEKIPTMSASFRLLLL